MAAARVVTPPPVTRFAPAPTGLLHLGHVVNAIYVWGLARRLDADVILRVEDHDRQRSRPEFEARLLDDLDWLGFVPDRYPTDTFRAGPCESRQSNRSARYARATERLRADGLVYACSCTRQEITRAQAAVGGPSSAYPGTCRSRNLPVADGLTWRVRLGEGSETFSDLLAGTHSQDVAEHQGDPAIRDRHGNWTYTFAVVVDDIEQGVTLVIRGMDLLAATAGQIQLARLLGRSTPATFAHHPVVMKSPTQKLSKADGDTGIADLRQAGWSAARVIGHAAALAGLAPEGHESPAGQAPALTASVQLASR